MLKSTKKEMMAACGLDCGPCEIRRTPNKPDTGQHIVPWFKKEGWLKEDEGINEVIERRMYCRGCRGDRSVPWSPDCWILKCCAEDNGHEFCYECVSFPCEQLSEWAKQNDDYGHALQRLKKMKEKHGTENSIVT